MDMEKFAETNNGHMQKRLLHSIVNMRGNYATTRILIRKDDFKSAYRQKHLSAQAAIQLATQINWKETLYVLISIRLTSGRANVPVTKSIADIGNALLLDNNWEPRENQAPN